MRNTLVLPYKVGSESAKTLAKLLNLKRMRLEGSSVTDSPNKTIINWGNSTTDLSHLPSVKVVNKSYAVNWASDKLRFFTQISGYNAMGNEVVNIPDWTTRKSEANDWYRDGHDVVCRAVLQGHSGEGLSIAKFDEDVQPSDAIPASKLYTKYVKKRDEYRVHVMGDTPFFVQRKAMTNVSSDVNWQVRNVANGFTFVVNNLNPDDKVLRQAVLAVKAIGLDFGAVDVVWNERRQEATVLEVNTACALQSETNQARYKEALTRFLNGERVLNWDEDLPLDEESATPLARLRRQARLSVPSPLRDDSFWESEALTIGPELKHYLFAAVDDGLDHSAIEDFCNLDYEGYSPDFKVVAKQGDIVRLSYWSEEYDEWIIMPFWAHWTHVGSKYE